MSLTVGGTTAQRKLIENWLRMICWKARVDPTSGKVTFTTDPAPAGACNPTSGCDCLEKLINSKDKAVTIHPETDSKKKIHVPESPLGPAEDTPLDKAHGGVTVPADGSTKGFENNGSPGDGCGSDVHIDMTNNKGQGYDDDGADLWLRLAHELTSGHALQLLNGTCATKKDEAEKQAIDSENKQRSEHGLPLRAIPG